MLQAVIEPVSNREDWIEQCEVRDENNQLIDLTGATIVVSVRDRTSKNILMTASEPPALEILGLGFFTWSFPVGQMRGLDASKQYEVGCTIKSGVTSVTKQFFVGTVSIIDGIVP
jgi:hypothetical protein